MDEADVCNTCGGHGFRVEIAKGSTVNVRSAQELGLMAGARRILCHCQPRDGAIKRLVEEEARKPQPRRKSTKKKTIAVAGIKPSAYVGQA